jgi:hypothetical protein
MKPHPNPDYSTSDIYFGAYLCCKGYPLSGSEKDNDSVKGRVRFLFHIGNYELEDAKNGFFSGKGTVKAKDFVSHVKSLKSICGT